MLRSAVRAVRPAVLAARLSFKPKSPTRIRPFSTTLPVSSGPPAPQLFGEGGKAGEVPSDIEQATGLERLQLLGELEGVDVFDESPLDASRIGTKANPVLVPSCDVERLVGCTGVPADSHDVAWFNLKQGKQSRCTECGSVYALDVSEGPLESRAYQ
ncbi:COX5B-domain-containing protein [Tricholoma matsutake]|nr:COX5B-domain-containing protein [Tricholoma matsutake 945]